jgi:hypothetical protein
MTHSATSVSLEQSSQARSPSYPASLTSVPRLPNVPRPRMSVCILADAADIDRAKQIDLEYMSADDLKKCTCVRLLSVLLPDADESFPSD